MTIIMVIIAVIPDILNLLVIIIIIILIVTINKVKLELLLPKNEKKRFFSNSKLRKTAI